MAFRGFGGGGFGQRQPFVKPESCLKRAEELSAIDKKEDALIMLNESLRQFRRTWTQATEDLVSKHLDLCVDLRNTRLAKDCIIQYRSICQQQNIQSLETVIKKFRSDSEKRAELAFKEAESIKKDELEDLDSEQAPDTILLGSVQTDVRMSSERELHAWFRYLWETYKMILDTLRNNKKLEDTYHETARIAFNFCADNKRPQEFKRLCEMLRFHYQNLMKPPSNQTGPAFVSHNDTDTVQKLLDTRFEQLRKATAMELWREAFATAEDLHMLMSKRKPRPFMLAQYYEAMQKIFWKSENYLFHAFGMMKYYLLCKQNRKNFPKEEEEQMASELLLASLVVPHDQKNARLLESDTVQMEKRKRLARLLGAGGLPTRASMKAEIQVKRIYENACEPARRLYDTLEGGITALELSSVCRPIIEEICAHNEGKLAHYADQLKVAVCHCILLKLSTVYSTMQMDRFQKIADILPWIDVEKATAAASKSGLVQLRISYVDRTVVFSTEDFSVSSMRNSLISIATTVSDFEKKFFAEEIKADDLAVRQKLFKNMANRREEEESEIAHRRHVIEDRKQVREKEEVEEEGRQKARALELLEEEEKANQRRQDEEKRRRDRDREERVKKEKDNERNKAYLDGIKEKIGKAGATIKVGDKALKDIAVEDLEKIGMSELEKAREQQVKKERDGLVRQRKAEQKRIDHSARALREKDVELLATWKVEEAARVKSLVQSEQEKKLGEVVAKHNLAMESKGWCVPHTDMKAKWVEEQMVGRREKWELRAKANRERHVEMREQRILDKVDNARNRKWEFGEEQIRKEKEEEEKAMKKEAERLREERRKKFEEEDREDELERQARREKAAKEKEDERERVQDRIRAKESELDNRRDDRDDDRDDRRGGRDDRDDRRGGRDDEDEDRGGAWRSAPRKDDRDDRRGGRDDRDDRRGGRDDRDDRRGGRDDRDDDRGAAGGAWGRGPPRDAPKDDRRGGGRDDDDGDTRFAGLRGAGGPPARRDDRDDRGPPRRDDRDDGDNWRGGGGRGGGRDDDRGPPKRNDDDDDPRFAKFRSGGGDRGPPARGGGGRDDDRGGAWRGGGGGRDDRGPPARGGGRDDGDSDPRFAALRGGGGGGGRDDDRGGDRGGSFRPPARGDFGTRKDEPKKDGDDDDNWRRR